MYKNLNEIPEKIRGFYHEEIKSELTGNMIEEEYRYIDENEEEVIGTKLVPEYEDVIYIFENKRHDLKSLEVVEGFIRNAKGRKSEVLDYFIGKYLELEDFEFLDKWKVWENELEKIEILKKNYIEPSEEDNVEIPDFSKMIEVHMTKEPVRSTQTIKEWKLENYRLLRKAMNGEEKEELDNIYSGYFEYVREAVEIAYPSKEV